MAQQKNKQEIKDFFQIGRDPKTGNVLLTHSGSTLKLTGSHNVNIQSTLVGDILTITLTPQERDLATANPLGLVAFSETGKENTLLLVSVQYKIKPNKVLTFLPDALADPCKLCGKQGATLTPGKNTFTVITSSGTSFSVKGGTNELCRFLLTGAIPEQPQTPTTVAETTESKESEAIVTAPAKETPETTEGTQIDKMIARSLNEYVIIVHSIKKEIERKPGRFAFMDRKQVGEAKIGDLTPLLPNPQSKYGDLQLDGCTNRANVDLYLAYWSLFERIRLKYDTEVFTINEYNERVKTEGE